MRRQHCIATQVIQIFNIKLIAKSTGTCNRAVKDSHCDSRSMNSIPSLDLCRRMSPVDPAWLFKLGRQRQTGESFAMSFSWAEKLVYIKHAGPMVPSAQVDFDQLLPWQSMSTNIMVSDLLMCPT